VKLDMSLVRDAHRSHTKLRLIGSMLELGRELGFDTIAEGVERVAEYRALVDVGCELFQGYLFARPGKAFPAPVFVEADEGRDEAERAQDREQEESAD